jgi:hypothetical protein
VEAGLVDELRRDEAQPAQTLDADGDAEERRAPVAAEALAGGQHRRHHHRAAVYRAALEGVIEVLAVGGGAAHHRRVLGAEPPHVADGGAGAAAVDAPHHCEDVLTGAGGDAETCHVDEQVLAARPHLGWEAPCGERCDPFDEQLGDGWRVVGRAHGLSISARSSHRRARGRRASDR